MDAAVTPSSETSVRPYIEKTDPIAHQKHGDMGHIVGWGADLDPANRPAVPMERTPPRLDNVHWTEPAAQVPHVKVYHSTERPGITPIFGSTAPPSGLSSKMRDLAFRYSENDLRHWLILLAADRVNVGEGLIHDLATGHIPNIFAEMGGPAEWRHNRAGFLRKVAIVSAVATVGVYLLTRRGDDDDCDDVND